MTLNIQRLGAPNCAVGEGPVWDPIARALFFIDMTGQKVIRFDPETRASQTWSTPHMIGSMVLRASGGAILSLADGFYALEFESGVITPFAKPSTLTRAAQLNDGKADRRGRFIVGGADSQMRDGIGEIYALDRDGGVRVLDRGFCISNGPCWSPDDRVFYIADSLSKNIYAYDYDIDSGTAANKCLWTNTEALGGIPDGATADADGLIWSAICEGGKIAAFRPDGGIERIIDTPVKLPSSVMFGGDNLDRLFFTSINPGVFGRPSAPDDGSLFVIDGLGARGLPEPYYGG